MAEIALKVVLYKKEEDLRQFYVPADIFLKGL